ncbi:PRC-barrel domain-containing protein [Azospirillum canadense]|uniref:PRC-barrel domain-containing protein n=1 Tax=Azospirillum canadense TaxID=403962 RepID=UPI002227F461|nr:PRC-barrel domain-containing protein [Azospirillum canadense]MCW2242400.1 sporulation protein YlmC with PRC-barrel domain [Azospirillum canadense]
MSQSSEASTNPLIESDRVEGTSVHGSDGQYIGVIKRLLIEKVSGQVVYAVVEFGGHLGFGKGRHTIPWPKLTYDTSLGGYHADVSEHEIQGAPDITRDENYDRLDRDAEEELHAYFRIPPYWRGI